MKFSDRKNLILLSVLSIAISFSIQVNILVNVILFFLTAVCFLFVGTNIAEEKVFAEEM